MCPTVEERIGWRSDGEIAATLGSRIRELRALLGLSQRALAVRLQISRSRLAKYESGLHAPPLGVLVRLAELLQVTVDSLLGCEIRDSRLVRCMREIEGMDEPTRLLVLLALEATVNGYHVVRDRAAAGATPQ
jgi:transcriptional regulator with XRE-family HTH domain